MALPCVTRKAVLLWGKRMNRAADVPASWNLPFTERLYADFLRDPASVAPEWAAYFEQLRNGEPADAPRSGPSFQPPSLFADPGGRGRPR